jgi:hypothetical protein
MAFPLPVPYHVDCAAAGLRLTWRLHLSERSYVGTFIAWSQVRDGDPEAAPPQLRLHDGRTVFVSAAYREPLRAALDQHSVPICRRPDVWGHLLEPFLDTDYNIVRSRTEQDLRSWGLTEDEIDSIRRRVRRGMLLLSMLTWEWQYFGQADVISACPHWWRMTSWLPWARYRRFRRWSDTIADRPYTVSG